MAMLGRSLVARRMLAGGAVLAVLVAVPSCAGPPPAPDRHQARGAPESPRSPAVAHQVPPIYRLTRSAALHRIELAKQHLTTSCMKRHGFTYDPAPPPGPDAAGPWPSPRPFGLETLDPREQPGPGASETPQSEAFGRALFGDPDRVVSARGATLTVSKPASGCMAEAEGHLLGDGRVRWIQLTILLHEADAQALARLDRDPELARVTAAWKRCMRDAGFSYDFPIQVLRGQPPGVDPGTIPAARADLRCKASTGYLVTAYARLTSLQREQLDKDPSVTGDWTRLVQRQDAIARAVLAG